MTSADSPLTELRETVAPALRAVRWYAAEIVVGIAVAVTALAALALTGAAFDDAAIDAERGTATAEVLDSSFSRTLIRFPTASGQAVVPGARGAVPARADHGRDGRGRVRPERSGAGPGRRPQRGRRDRPGGAGRGGGLGVARPARGVAAPPAQPS